MSGGRRSTTDALAPADSARIFAIYRALARGLELAASRNQALPRWTRVATGLAGLADLAELRAIRRSRLSLGARLAIDLADIAFFAGPARTDLTTALTGLVAMDFEAGVAAGPFGLVVPLVATGVASLARMATGEPPDPAQGIPHVGAVIGGITIRRGERVRAERAREIHAAELSARRVRAFLAGQPDVAMGASTVIDQLKPVAILLEADEPGSTLNQIRAGWRESLAEQAQQHAVFLDSAVRVWEQLHNDHPDLDGYVTVTIAEGDGTTLLTGYQARALANLLEALDLRSSVEFALRRSPAAVSGGTRPGRAFHLLVNGEALEVPADPSAKVVRFNPAPPAFFFGAWAALMPTRATDGNLPLSRALLCSAAFLIAGLALLGQPPEVSARRAQWTGTALAALQGAVCVTGCSVQRDRLGRHLFQGTYGIAPAGLLLAANRVHLSRRDRALAVVMLAAIVAATYRAADRPRSLVDLAVALGHPLAASLGMDAFARAAALATERIAAELSREDEEEEAAAFEDGRRHVLGLARVAFEEAVAAFAARTDLDSSVRASVGARLEAIRQLMTTASDARSLSERHEPL
jgi:hypothetical protein